MIHFATIVGAALLIGSVDKSATPPIPVQSALPHVIRLDGFQGIKWGTLESKVDLELRKKFARSELSGTNLFAYSGDFGGYSDALVIPRFTSGHLFSVRVVIQSQLDKRSVDIFDDLLLKLSEVYGRADNVLVFNKNGEIALTYWKDGEDSITSSEQFDQALEATNNFGYADWNFKISRGLITLKVIDNSKYKSGFKFVAIDYYSNDWSSKEHKRVLTDF